MHSAPGSDVMLTSDETSTVPSPRSAEPLSCGMAPSVSAIFHELNSGWALVASASLVAGSRRKRWEGSRTRDEREMELERK